MYRFAALSLFSLASTASLTHAQLSIPWFTIDGGGGVSTGGAFTVSGTIGQPDAGQAMLGGTFAVTGGFWAGFSTPVCPADFNQSGAVNVQDIFDFLAAWFSGC